MIEDHSLDKFTRIALLFDFYGQLLTDRQRQALSLYYEDNLSLGEIAGEFNVSRQAIFDLLKRAEKILEGYEEKLGLVCRWQLERDHLSQILVELKECYATRDLVQLKVLIARLTDMIGDGGDVTNGHV